MRVNQFEPFVGEEEYAAIKDCFVKNWNTEGPKAKEFSQRLGEMIGVKFAVFAPNGTLALYLGLKAMGVGPGDEVIVPDFTFIASANAVEMVGARPVFADVKRTDFQLDVQDCERVLSPKTRAIMPVHIYGSSANMTEVMEFAKKHRLMVIEDSAQGLGVTWKGKGCGSFGEVGCFSFFADKTITTGEGGLVVTNEKEIYENLLYLRNQGRINRGSFIHPAVGYNFRMTDLQIAVGLAQLDKFPKIVEMKRKVYARYEKQLAGIKQISFRQVDADSSLIPFRVVITCERAHELMAFMSKQEIEPRTFFYPLHRQPCFQYLVHDQDWRRKLEDRNFPNAVFGYENGVCLPSYAALKEEQVDYVCDTIKRFYAC